MSFPVRSSIYDGHVNVVYIWRNVELWMPKCHLKIFKCPNIRNGVARTLKKYTHIKGDYWNKQRFSSISSLFKMGTYLKGKNLLPEGANSLLLEQFLMVWKNHFYHIRWPPLNVTIFITHVRSCANDSCFCIIKLLNTLRKNDKCRASLAFYLFSSTCLINAIILECTCKILDTTWEQAPSVIAC